MCTAQEQRRPRGTECSGAGGASARQRHPQPAPRRPGQRSAGGIRRAGRSTPPAAQRQCEPERGRDLPTAQRAGKPEQQQARAQHREKVRQRRRRREKARRRAQRPRHIPATGNRGTHAKGPAPPRRTRARAAMPEGGSGRARPQGHGAAAAAWCEGTPAPCSAPASARQPTSAVSTPPSNGQKPGPTRTPPGP